MPEEETLAMETVAQDLAAIEAEPGINALGESITEETTVDYFALASEAIDLAWLQELEARYATIEETEEMTLSPQEVFELQPELVQIQAAPAAVASSNPVMAAAKAYRLNLDGREVYAWFPGGAVLGVSEDGYLYNETGSNITGVIADSLDGLAFNSYNDTVTVSPLLNSSGNNNAYRYGSRVYITDYYTSGNTLYNSTQYISSATVLDTPGAGYGFTRYQVLIFFLLGVLAVFSLLRLLWRDR